MIKAPNKGEVKRIATQLCIMRGYGDMQRLLDFANVFYLRGVQSTKRNGKRDLFIIEQFKSGKTQKEIARMLKPKMGATSIQRILKNAGVTSRDGGAHVRALKREGAGNDGQH